MTKALTCPSCGAPLNYEPQSPPVIECAFCGQNVIVPTELQSRGDKNAVFDAFAGLDLSGEHVEALQDIVRELAAGRKIGAIKRYREAFGVDLKEAKDAIETLQKTGTLTITNQQINIALPQTSSGSGGGMVSCLIAVVVLIIVFAVSLLLFIPSLGAAVGISADNPLAAAIERGDDPTSPPSPVPTSTPMPAPTPPYTRFGREGIGPGQFTDARRIAVDGAGYIYVGEWDGGRIQRFDPSGTFDSFWMVDPKRPVTGLAADREGNVYVIQGWDVARHNGATGELLGELPPAADSGYRAVTVAPDGHLVVVTGDAQIIHMDAQGNPLDTPAISLRELDLDTDFPPDADVLAVDGLGYLYALDETNYIVMKFGPDGQYLDKFGGRGEGPGRFQSPDSLAVDSQGRLYVGQTRRIQIFDRDSNYLAELPFDTWAFGMTINDRNELYVAARVEFLKFDLGE